MKLKVLAPLPAKYKLRYVVEIEFMYGDADGEEFKEFNFETPEETITFIQKLNKIKKWYRPDWRHEDKEPKEVFEDWPHDPCGFDDTLAAYIGYKVFFYDVRGDKCPVKVTR